MLNNLSLYKMYVAMHVLNFFRDYQNLLSLELNIDTDKDVSIFISQANTFLYSPQHTSICAYYYYNVCPSTEETCLWVRGKEESFPVLDIRCFTPHMEHPAAPTQTKPLLTVVTLDALNTGLIWGSVKLTAASGRGSKPTTCVL